MSKSNVLNIPAAPKLDKQTRVAMKGNGKVEAPALPEFIEAKNRKGKAYRIEARFITASGGLVQFKSERALTDYVTLRRKEKLPVKTLKADYELLRANFNTISCIVAHTIGTDGLRRLAVRSLSKEPSQVAYTMSGRTENTGTLIDWSAVQAARKAERDATK